MEQSFDIGRIVDIVRRRYMFFLVPALLISVVAVLVAYILPRSYEAKAIILIESQRIPTELASSTITASPGERIKIIEQRLLARDNLLDIAEKYSLYRNEDKVPSPTSVVESMRSSITIEQISVTRSRRNLEVIGFNVAFRYSDATMTSRVANELVSSILSQNLETRLSRAAETSEFFQQQLRDLEVELLSLENEIATFKRDKEAVLPETISSRRLELTSISAQIAQIDQQVRIAEISSTDPAAAGASTQQLAFKLQSQELNHEAFLERRELLTPLAEKGFVSKKTMADLDRQIAQSEIQITSIKSQMAQQGFTGDPDSTLKLLKSQRTELVKAASELKQSISETPAVEVELSSMTRDYENLQNEYRLTKSKLTDAQIGERLEQDRQAERFEVLEQATVPEAPTKPNRPQIVLAGFGGGMAAGIALVLLLEFLDNSIRSARDLESRLQIRAIAVIPYVTTTNETRSLRWKRLFVFFLLIGSIAAALAAIDYFYLPLDLLAERVWVKIEPFVPNYLLP